MSFRIMAFAPDHEPEVVALSLRAWAPVFAKLEPVVPTYVYEAFYPDGWRVRQEADVRQFLRAEGGRAWVAVATGFVVGWVGVRLHPEDRMGEIHILAVDPAWQRRGVAGALMGHVMTEMRRAGMEVVMVETGDDPGHAPARAAYERVGFERWPVARYFRKLRSDRVRRRPPFGPVTESSESRQDRARAAGVVPARRVVITRHALHRGGRR